MHRIIVILGALSVLPGCVLVSRDEPAATPAYVEAAAPSYPPGSPYAPEAAYASSRLKTEPDAAAGPYDPYCAEAVRQAEAASAQAAVSGSPRDAARAERTAGFARRDCR